LHAMRRDSNDAEAVLGVLKALVASTSAIIPDLVRFAILLDVIEVFSNADLELSLRASAIGLLASLCQDDKHGQTSLIHATKVIPRSLIEKAIRDPKEGVQLFDADSENPELLWNSLTRKELASAVREMRKEVAELEEKAKSSADVHWGLTDGYRVPYTLYEDHFIVGGVFLKLFLKDPQFELRDAKMFLEAMLENFFEMWSEQTQASSEQYMMLVSGIVCITKSRPTLADHISTLGYIPRMVTLLLDAQGEVRLVKETAIMRLLHELSVSEKCVERFASVPAAFESLMKVIRPLPHPLAFCLDTMKLLLEKNLRVHPSIVPQALEAKAIPFLLGLLEGTSIEHVDDPGAAKVHAIGCLQMMARSGSYGEQVTLVLDQSPVWTRYKNQKHDLFISRQQKKDYFLTDGSASTKLLLTAGEPDETDAE